MNEKTVEILFGSADKMKIVRMFVFNPEKVFGIDTIVSRIPLTSGRIKKEIKNLARIGLIIRKGKGFILDKTFPYLFPLQEFLSATNPTGEEIAAKMKGAGKIHFLVLAGVFIRNPESRLDMLVVGDRIKKPVLAKVLKSIESRVGKELTFSVFDTADFKYRVDMRDKLIMDVLDFPHEKIVNKLGI